MLSKIVVGMLYGFGAALGWGAGVVIFNLIMFGQGFPI